MLIELDSYEVIGSLLPSGVGASLTDSTETLCCQPGWLSAFSEELEFRSLDLGGATGTCTECFSVPGGTLEQLKVAASHFDFGQSRKWAK